MSAPDPPEPASRGGRATALWVSAVVLAAAATAVLVISDDARLLRLGLVAALWAALVGAFAVARLRNRIVEDDERADELQRVYELELQREVEARQEFELEAENEARKRVADESRGEVEALRAELRHLRESLEQILGGDVLFERVALRAESTRVRSLTESGGQQHDGRVIQSREHRGRELPPPPAGNEAGTELINRISGEQQRPPQREPPKPAAPKPAAPKPPAPRPPAPRPPAPKPAAPEPPAPEPTAPKSSVPKPAPPRPVRPERPQYVRPVGHTPPTGTSLPAQQEVEPTAESAPPEQVPPDQQVPPEQEAAPKVSKQDAGAHAEGTSVNELLAAYGNSKESRKHRRRRE